VTLKTAFTVGFAALAVVVLAVLVVKTRVALTLTGIAALLALALQHAVARLERAGLRRGLAISVVLFLLVVLMVCLGMLVIPTAITQGEALLAQLPELMRQVRSLRVFHLLSGHFEALAQLGQGAEAPVPARTPGLLTMPPLLRAIGGAVSLAGATLTVFFLVVFMLVFGGGLLRRMLAQVLGKVYHAIGGYLSGLTLICTINATLTTTVLALLGLPFFLPLGIASGFSSMVPYAGPVVAGGFITLLTWVTAGPWQATVVLIYFVIYGQIEGNVIAPLMFRRTVHVNPLLTLMAVLFCAELAGIVGAVVAVPVVATVQIIIRELLQLRQERRAAASG
jgi:predicted PurR-regulated permease PerM